jgi:hypothetical protein
MVSVFVLMSVTFDQAMVSVFALMSPFEVTSPVTSDHAIVSVFVLIPEMFPVPISEMRVATLLFTVVMSDQSIESVFVFTARRRAPSDDEALFVFAFTLAVLAEMALASEVEALLVFEFTEETALVTSDAVASEPVVSEAPVRVRVALLQISETNEPRDVKVREVFDHTDEAIVDDETMVVPTTKVLSTFTRSPPGTLPQTIIEGQTPSGPIDGIE